MSINCDAIELDFAQLGQLIFQVVSDLQDANSTDQIDVFDVIDRTVTNHGGRIVYFNTYPPARVEFDSAQELSMWMLKYM